MSNIKLKDSVSYDTKTLFDTRGTYLDNATKYTPKQQAAVFLKDADRNYGRVFRDVVYFPDESKNKKKNLSELNPKAKNFLFVQNFVRDAFSALDEYYTAALKLKKIEDTDSVLLNLVPQKTFSSVNTQHLNHLIRLANLFLEYALESDKASKILNIKDLTNTFISFLNEKPGSIYFSREKYMLSPQCDPFTSGLSIALDVLDPNNDLLKYNNYITDVNFNFFLECARRFSFYVSVEDPHILHFDFESPAAKTYIQKYSDISDDKFGPDVMFYKNRCIPAYSVGPSALKSFISYCYKRFISKENKEFSTIENITDGLMQVKINYRSDLPRNYETGKDDFLYWQFMYGMVRSIEEGVMLTATEREKLHVDIRNAMRYGGDKMEQAASLAVFKFLRNR